MVAVPVNPQVLVWARDQRGLHPDDAAELLGIPSGELFLIESGNRDLTLGELESFARKYQFPLATLLMPEPLPDLPRPKLRDFRAFEGDLPKALSPDTLVAIEDVNEYIDMLDDLRQEDASLFRTLRSPKYELSDDAEEVANEERKRLSTSVEEQLAWTTDREAFLRWRELAEGQGLFSYQLTLGPDDSRGFAVWDDRKVPAIVIDVSEAPYPGRIFTIWHEYAHILLRQGGISNQNRNNKVERFCNQFSAFYLMPKDIFIARAKYIESDKNAWNISSVARLAKIFKVSNSAAALHLEELGIARKGVYGQVQAIKRKNKKGGGITAYAERQVNRLGTNHIDVVFKALKLNIINKVEAYEYTGVRPKHFDDLHSIVTGRRAAYGRSS